MIKGWSSMSCHAHANQRWLNMLRAAVVVVLSLVLLVSGSLHLANPYYFLGSIFQYDIVNQRSGIVLATVVPFLQLTLGVCLLIPYWRRSALFLCALMFGLFFVAQSSVLWRHMRIDCGCFGHYSAATGTNSLLFVGSLFFGAVLAAWYKEGSPDLTGIGPGDAVSPSNDDCVAIEGCA